MADVFDIDGGYHQKRDEYNHRGSGGWIPVETKSASRNDPRLNRRDDSRKYSPGESPRRSPQRMSKSAQMYNQMPPAQSYPQAPPPPMYSEYNSGYGTATASYTHNYQQQYQLQQSQNQQFQYNPQSSYQPQNQGYNHNAGQHHQHQPGPPGDEYPNSWAPVPPTYSNMGHPPPPPVPRPASVASTAHTNDSKNDDQKKEAIAQELKQQRATLVKQRDEYLRKASVLRRELEKLRMQKHELLAEKSPPRDSQRILRENAKLQLEIQNKLKSINNVVDMLSGIIGDGLKAEDYDAKANSSDSTPKRTRKNTTGDSDIDDPGARSGKSRERERGGERSTDDAEWPHVNYIHYDPELHWCRVCDVFPRSAKDFLNHLHSAEHRQVTQEHQLVDTPWHKLPTDPELPSYKGAPVKRVPIKGLQFFISATSWYCKLCDVWIGDLHCASLHLKSKNHSHNYSNFVEQNPHWEANWLKDREKAYARCAKAEGGNVPPAPEPPNIKDKLNKKQLKRQEKESPFLEPAKEKKRKKKSKKRKKNSSDSSSSSSSSDSSTEDESDKAKSIRVAMRNKMRMQAQMILNEEISGKLEALKGLVEEKRTQEAPMKEATSKSDAESANEDNIINQWMTVTTNHDKHILDNLKGRLKQRQEADKEKAIEAAAEQRRREREREERELKEMRDREQREIEEKMREEREKEERDREERERIKERERSRRKRRSESRSPESERSRGYNRSRGRSRSRSVGRRGFRRGRTPDRYHDRRDSRERQHRSPEFKPPVRKRDYDDEEDDYVKHDDYKGKGKRLVSTLSHSHSRKLPFIGRMPLFKKRGDGEEKEIKKEDYEIRLSKFEPGNTARAFIPEPGVVHIMKLATPPDLMPLPPKISAENPPPPPKIIPEPPQISESAPPPPMINDVVTTVEETEVQDMELDEAVAPPPPGVPVAEAKPLVKPAGNHLPRDFQDALNIIFPGDQTAEQYAAMQYQYQMGYGMMYPGMEMYGYGAATSTTEETAVAVPETTETTEAVAETEQTEDKADAPPGVDDKEDLAMLGIDAEDMAAQTF